jgi:hypothetical protein
MVDEQEWTAEQERAFGDVPEFPGVIRRFMDERGIVSLEEMHGRFIESGRGGHRPL